MKVLSIIVAAFSFFVIQNIAEIRDAYYEASKSKQNAEKFYNELSKYNKNNSVILAYKGAALALKSKYTFNKKDKKDFFVSGVKLIENAVKEEPQNLEIRLVRLSIQENTPKFLKYKSNLEEDKKLILLGYDKQPKEIKECVKKYVAHSNVFIEGDKQKIK